MLSKCRLLERHQVSHSACVFFSGLDSKKGVGGADGGGVGGGGAGGGGVGGGGEGSAEASPEAEGSPVNLKRQKCQLLLTRGFSSLT